MTVVIIVLILVLAIVGTFSFFMFRSLLKPSKIAPYVSSFNRHLELMKKLEIKKGAKILDLGCGDGKALRFFSKQFEVKSCHGYDLNFYAVIYGKILNLIFGHKNIHIKQGNFLKANLKGYDYIYVYLRTRQLAEIEDRLRENKDKDTIIISNSFEFTKHKEFDSINNSKGKKSIFLYK
ncbi:MAG TPA: class I SAM-dependent methyltransferase [Candidatus Absconditabacterales bacterium]|nr:class I SAM-dependent methyltransferase [Candidatus Absconditabacterales bacterium]